MHSKTERQFERDDPYLLGIFQAFHSEIISPITLKFEIQCFFIIADIVEIIFTSATPVFLNICHYRIILSKIEQSQAKNNRSMTGKQRKTIVYGKTGNLIKQPSTIDNILTPVH